MKRSPRLASCDDARLPRSSAIYTNPVHALRRDASDVIPLTVVDGDWRDKKSSLVPFGRLLDATVDIAGTQRIYFSWRQQEIGSRGSTAAL